MRYTGNCGSFNTFLFALCVNRDTETRMSLFTSFVETRQKGLPISFEYI